MKQPRFVREYANWRIKQIKMGSDIDRDARIERIQKATRLCERGLISVDEAIRTILRA